MDDLTRSLADYAREFRSDSLSQNLVETVVDHIADALGCAIAARDEDSARIARELADEGAVVGPGASVVGLARQTTPERAAMANSIAMRCLDYNDTFNGLKTGGHPSDMIAGVLAAAEMAKLPGRALIDGTFIAYEVFGTLADQIPLRDNATDQGPLLGLGVAAAISNIRRLDLDQTGNALSLAVTTTMPLRSARSGELSMWKGAATGHAVGNAVLTTALAARGMEGPPAAFRGADAFLTKIPVPVDLAHLGKAKAGQSIIERTGFKYLPVEWGAQAAVELFLNLAKQIRPDDVESITIYGNEFLVKEIGGGRGDAKEKWDPQTRETADHSLPYLVARALTDGRMTLASFAPDKVLDPAIRPLMQKIKVQLLPDIKDYDATRQPVRVMISLRDGQTLDERCEYAIGHAMRPGTRAQLDEKFFGLVEPVIGRSMADRILTQIRNLAAMGDVSELTASLRAISKE